MLTLPVLPDGALYEASHREQSVVLAWVKRRLLPCPYKMPGLRPRKMTAISPYETFRLNRKDTSSWPSIG